MKLQRAYFIPEGYRKIETPAGLPAEVYVQDGPIILACAFVGKQSRPAWHFRFRTIEARDERIRGFFEGIAHAEDYKIARRSERSAFKTTLKPGDILYSSWGYDQTNYDFYQVVSVVGPQTVIIQEIGADSRSEGWCRDALTPVKDRFLDKSSPRRVRVRPGESVKVRDFGVWASLYTGGEKHSTSYA